MKYPMKLNRTGNLVSLPDVADAIAFHAASGYGHSRLHEPTLANTRPAAIDLLLHVVRIGQLPVYDGDGNVLPSNAVTSLDALSVRTEDLHKWADSNGDEFNVSR